MDITFGVPQDNTLQYMILVEILLTKVDQLSESAIPMSVIDVENVILDKTLQIRNCGPVQVSSSSYVKEKL